MFSKIVLAAACVATATAEVLYSEDFDAKWEDRWAVGKSGDKTLGKFALENGGIKTSEDNRHYFLSTKFDKPISNAGKDLVIQYTVKFTETPDCGGSYIKLLKDFETKDFDNETPYNIMFGPDQCGGTKRVHAIITYKDENKLKTSDVSLSIYDTETHLFTFHIKKDQTYEIFIDNESKAAGSITDDWDVLAAKKINDPALSKPADWVEEAQMDDPEDKKPEGHDDIKENVVDPEASKPEDWDDEDDGEWEAPTIKNPEFKGAFKAKRIDNPEYKGEWVHAQIDNPEFAEDATLHESSSAGIGFELWQVKAGALFDNILVADDVADAKKFDFASIQAAEKKAKEEADAAKKVEDDAAAAKAKAEEDAKKAEEPAAEEKTEEAAEEKKEEL